jgi:hypothetical protein
MAKEFDRVLVFAGAGASKAVNGGQFPTTREFFDQLPSEVTSDVIFRFVLDYLRSKQGIEAIDIEHVLWALQELHEFYDSVAASRGLGGYAIQTNLLGQLFGGQNSGHLVQSAPHMRDRLGQLIDNIDRIVFELYGYEPSPAELQNNWTRMISRLEGVGSRLDLFTTNYDVVIEAALNNIAGDVTSRSYRGIRGVMRQSVDLTNWAAGHEPQEVLLTKLHGSLDWKYGPNSIQVGDAVFTGDHSKQAIIYPGFKGKNDAPFFDVFHNYLAEALADSKAMIFVGFAFRDDHINEIIRENTRGDSVVVVLNPDKSVKFPARRTRAKYIHELFDVSSVDRACKMIGVE